MKKNRILMVGHKIYRVPAGFSPTIKSRHRRAFALHVEKSIVLLFLNCFCF